VNEDSVCLTTTRDVIRLEHEQVVGKLRFVSMKVMSFSENKGIVPRKKVRLCDEG